MILTLNLNALKSKISLLLIRIFNKKVFPDLFEVWKINFNKHVILFGVVEIVVLLSRTEEYIGFASKNKWL